MSADNGVYILHTKGPEYRVIHAAAIDNIDYDPPQGLDFNPDVALDYFGQSKVYKSEAEALLAARQIQKGLPICEYGICTIDYSSYLWKDIVNLWKDIVSLEEGVD